jgi:hypothetical protein
VHCDVAPVLTVAGLQVTKTEVIEGEVSCTVRVALPSLVVSWTLVAVTVTVPAEAGAVKSPLGLMVPPLAVHVTAEL